MKTKTSTVRLLFATALLGLFASFAHAGPGVQYYQNLGREQQFKELKVADKVAFVCNECKSVSEITIKSAEQAMALCKEGESVMCPSCNKKTKIIVKAARNDPPSRTEVVYVNDKGEECAFLMVSKTPSKETDKKAAHEMNTHHIMTQTQAEALKPGDTMTMACMKCKDVMAQKVTTGQEHVKMMTVGEKMSCHGCEGTVEVVATGKGEGKDAEVKHVCSKCGESLFCSATKAGSGATEHKGHDKK